MDGIELLPLSSEGGGDPAQVPFTPTEDLSSTPPGRRREGVLSDQVSGRVPSSQPVLGENIFMYPREGHAPSPIPSDSLVADERYDSPSPTSHVSQRRTPGEPPMNTIDSVGPGTSHPLLGDNSPIFAQGDLSSFPIQPGSPVKRGELAPPSPKDRYDAISVQQSDVSSSFLSYVQPPGHPGSGDTPQQPFANSEDTPPQLHHGIASPLLSPAATMPPAASVAANPPAQTTPAALDALDDPRWKEWQEWREWKMQQEWKDFCRWEEARKRNDVPADHNVDTNQQRTQSATQGGSAPAPAVVNAPVINETVKGGDEVRTEFVLSGQPTGWAAIDKVLRDYDEEKVKYCKEDIDTLLVFAGLFSAVLTAFLIESYQNLTENRSSSNGSPGNSTILQLPDTQSPDTASPFQPSSADIRVNVLWFASLLFSLIAASFGILVKQWLREYMAVQNPSPQARLRVRHLRYPQLAKWKVFEIAAALPLLLQLSLSLFFIGLCYFTASVHSSIGNTTLPLVIGWALCFIVTIVLPLLAPRCPYRTTLLQAGISRLHRFLYNIFNRPNWDLPGDTQDKDPKSFELPPDTSQPFPTTSQSFSHSLLRKFQLFRWLFWQSLCHFLRRANEEIMACDEEKIAQLPDKDLEILVAADAVQSNDELLDTAIAESVQQMEKETISSEQLLRFIGGVLINRLIIPASSTPCEERMDELIIDLRQTSLSSRSREALTRILRNRLPAFQPNHRPTSLFKKLSTGTLAIMYLLSESSHDSQHISQLVEAFTDHKAGKDIASYFRRLVLLSSSQSAAADSRGASLRRRLLDALSSVHHISRAQWNFLPALHAIITGAEGHDNSYTKSWREPLERRERHWMLPLAIQTMHTVAKWPLSNYSDTPRSTVTADVIKFITGELDVFPSEAGRDRYRVITFGYEHIPHDFRSDPIALELAVTLLCIHRHEEKTLSITSFEYLASRPALCHTLACAISCLPTAEILALCQHETQSSYRFDSRGVQGERANTWMEWMDVVHYHILQRETSSTCSSWQGPQVYIHSSHDSDMVLKLLAFVLCLFSSSAIKFRHMESRITGMKNWAAFFNPFIQTIPRFCKHRPRRTEALVLAMACFEIIRYEETLAKFIAQKIRGDVIETRIDGILSDPGPTIDFYFTAGAYQASQNGPSPPSTDLVPPDFLLNSNMPTRLLKGWRNGPLSSCIPEALIVALDKSVPTSWSDEGYNSEGGHADTITFKDYHSAYISRLGNLVSMLNDKHSLVQYSGDISLQPEDEPDSESESAMSMPSFRDIWSSDEFQSGMYRDTWSSDSSDSVSESAF